MAASANERRRAYRQRNMKAGKCRYCPNPAFSAVRTECLRHYVLYYLRKRGLTKGVLGKTQHRRREKFVAYATGRYTAVRNGYLVPGTREELLRDIVELRLRIGIRWGGFRGADKMATIIRQIDNLALRRKKDAEANRTDVPLAVSGPPLDEPSDKC